MLIALAWCINYLFMSSMKISTITQTFYIKEQYTKFVPVEYIKQCQLCAYD